MKTYRHTQRAHFILIAFGLVSLAFLVTGGFVLRPVLVALPIILVSAWLFHSLTVEVVDGDLRLAFGPGWIRKCVRLSEIASCQPVRTSWLDGWGIHFTRYGWLYNVSGFDAVAITLKDGKRICVGTDEPQKLVAHLGS